MNGLKDGRKYRRKNRKELETKGRGKMEKEKDEKRDSKDVTKCNGEKKLHRIEKWNVYINKGQSGRKGDKIFRGDKERGSETEIRKKI